MNFTFVSITIVAIETKVVIRIMKSSTLHRSSLTKERMSMLENVKFQAQGPLELNQYVRVNRTPELDVLYRSLEKSSSHGMKPSSRHKTPGVYLSLGFIAGAVFLLVVGLVVWISSLTGDNKASKQDSAKGKGNLEVVSETGQSQEVPQQEKYVIKSGDTLEKIALRFYGKYDVNKIEEIKRINNITRPEGLQIGQVVIVPLSK